MERHAFSPATTASNPLSFRIRVSGEESAFLCGRSRSVARSRLASPHRTDAFRRGKAPPKRSLDGAPSRLEMNAIARATRPYEPYWFIRTISARSTSSCCPQLTCCAMGSVSLLRMGVCKKESATFRDAPSRCCIASLNDFPP